MEIILLNLIVRWGKIVEDSYWRIGQTHIVPQLLAMNIRKLFYGLTFKADVFLYQEVHIVVVLKHFSSKLDFEMMFTLKDNTFLPQSYGQCILINIFTQPATKFLMNGYSTAYNIKHIRPKFLHILRAQKLH